MPLRSTQAARHLIDQSIASIQDSVPDWDSIIDDCRVTVRDHKLSAKAEDLCAELGNAEAASTYYKALQTSCDADTDIMGEVNGAYHTAIQEIMERRARILAKIDMTGPDDQRKINALRDVFSKHPLLTRKAFEGEDFVPELQRNTAEYIKTLRTYVSDLLEQVKRVRDNVLSTVREELKIQELRQKFEFYRRFAQEQHQSALNTSAIVQHELRETQAALQEVITERDKNHADVEAEREKVRETERRCGAVEVERDRIKGLVDEKDKRIQDLESDVKRLSLVGERVKTDMEAKQQQIGILQKEADGSRQLVGKLEEDIKNKATRIEELETTAAKNTRVAEEEIRRRNMRIEGLATIVANRTTAAEEEIQRKDTRIEELKTVAANNKQTAEQDIEQKAGRIRELESDAINNKERAECVANTKDQRIQELESAAVRDKAKAFDGAQKKDERIRDLESAAVDCKAKAEDDVRRKDTQIQELEAATADYKTHTENEAKRRDQRIRDLESAADETAQKTTQLEAKVTNLEATVVQVREAHELTLENKDKTSESLRDELKQAKQRQEAQEKMAKEARHQADLKSSEQDTMVQKLEAEVSKAGRVEENAMRSMIHLLAAICEPKDVEVRVELVDQMVQLHRDWTEGAVQLHLEGYMDPTILLLVFSEAGSNAIVVHTLCLWYCVHAASGRDLVLNVSRHGQAVFNAACEWRLGTLRTWVADAVSKMVSRLIELRDLVEGFSSADDFGYASSDRQLDASNSSLPVGVSLIADESGLIFYLCPQFMSVFSAKDIERVVWILGRENAHMPLVIRFKKGSVYLGQSIVVSEGAIKEAAFMWVKDFLRMHWEASNEPI
ncbi:MAG: hypothetical protein Q9208_003580 [Pyrenodesmia sp. 3 TL-2023]